MASFVGYLRSEARTDIGKDRAGRPERALTKRAAAGRGDRPFDERGRRTDRADTSLGDRATVENVVDVDAKPEFAEFLTDCEAADAV